MTKIPASVAIGLVGLISGPIVAIAMLVWPGLQSRYGISPFGFILVMFFGVISIGSAVLAIAIRLLVRLVWRGIAGEIVAVTVGSIAGAILTAWIIAPAEFRVSWISWISQLAPTLVLVALGSVAIVLVWAAARRRGTTPPPLFSRTPV
jgi:hypothetical protein